MITLEEIKTQPVRALNWKHPYAELMLHGKQETRTWNTVYRGLVLICASVMPYADRELIQIAGPEQYARIIQTLGPKWYNHVKRGSAIAIARLVGSGDMQPADENATFVQFRRGLFVHRYEAVTPINPIPWRGSQGWQKVTPEQKALIKPL